MVYVHVAGNILTHTVLQVNQSLVCQISTPDGPEEGANLFPLQKIKFKLFK